MTVFQGIQHPSLQGGGDLRQWWSPLSPSEVSAALLKLGASPVNSRRHDGWAVALSDDAFAPSLVFEPAPLDRGTSVRVQVKQLGFGRDFSLLVQAVLTIFALLLAVSASWTFANLPALDVLFGIALLWALLMGVFAGLRCLVAWVAGRCLAYERTCARVRVALFARRV